MRSQPRYFSDSFKLGVISRVLSGEMSKEQARIHYGIGGNSAILNWMRSFGYSTISPLPVPMKKPHAHPAPTIQRPLSNKLRIFRGGWSWNNNVRSFTKP